MSSCNILLPSTSLPEARALPSFPVFSTLPLAADLSPRVAVLCGRGAVVPTLPLSCSEMSCTIEKALADAKALVERLREHDSAAEALIEQTTVLNKRVEAMKQVCSPALLAPGNNSICILWVLQCSTQ